MPNLLKGYCKHCGQPSNFDHEICVKKNANNKGYLDAFVVTVLLFIYFYAKLIVAGIVQ